MSTTNKSGKKSASKSGGTYLSANSSRIQKAYKTYKSKGKSARSAAFTASKRSK